MPTEDNDDNLEGKISENSLQHKIGAVLKYLQAKYSFLWGKG